MKKANLEIEKKIQQLSRLWYLDVESERLLDELGHYQYKSAKLRRALRELPKQTILAQQLTNCNARLEKVQVELTDVLEQIAGMRGLLQRCINQVEDERYRLLLSYRFLNFKTWEEIADSMHYSYQHVNRLFNQAIACLRLPQNMPELYRPAAS